jgi:hypothetical protein
MEKMSAFCDFFVPMSVDIAFVSMLSLGVGLGVGSGVASTPKWRL